MTAVNGKFCALAREAVALAASLNPGGELSQKDASS